MNGQLSIAMVDCQRVVVSPTVLGLQPVEVCLYCIDMNAFKDA